MRPVATQAEVDFTSLLALDDRAAFGALGVIRRFRAGAILLLEGDRSDHVFVVREGHVKVTTGTDDGREVVLAIRGPGSLVGEFAALSGGAAPRLASVVANEPVAVQVIPADEFLRYLEANPRVLLLLVRTIIDGLRTSDHRRVEFGAFDAQHRLGHLLCELAEVHGRSTGAGIEIEVRLSQDELAGMAGMSRESVTRALTVFRRRGLVHTGRREVVVTDLDGLRAFLR